MSIFKRFKKNKSKKRIASLIDEYVLKDGKNRDSLIKFCQDETNIAEIDSSQSYSSIVEGPLIFFPIIQDDFELFSLLKPYCSDLFIKYQNMSFSDLIWLKSTDQRFVQLFLDMGKDLNQEISSGGTPLLHSIILCTSSMTASNDKSIERLKFLLEKGADPNNGGEGLQSPLMQAVGRIDIVKLLLEFEADIDRKYRIAQLDKTLDVKEFIQINIDNLGRETAEKTQEILGI
jgi:hypothetical protein